VTGSADNTARVWDAKSGAELLALKGHADGVTSASFSADGSRIVTGGGWGGKVWRRGPCPQGAHRLRPFGGIQPGRFGRGDRGFR
jgi:hypothetical protein